MDFESALLHLRKRRRGEKTDTCSLKSSTADDGKFSPEGSVEREDNPQKLLPLHPHDVENPRAQILRSPRCEVLDFTDILPESLSHLVFLKLPPRDIAGRCSLVCKAWSRLASNEAVWKDLCTPYTLQESDTMEVLGGWRGLYATALGSNLIQSAHFERLYPSSSMAAGYEDEPRPFEPRAEVLVERMSSIGEADAEYRSRSHWTDDIDFHAGNIIPPANGVFRTRTCGAVTCIEDGQHHMSLRLGDALAHPVDERIQQPGTVLEVVRTEHKAWGRLKQQISLSAFPGRFLDMCPAMQISALCRPLPVDDSGYAKIRMQMLLCDDEGQVLHHWDSGELEQRSTEWRIVAADVRGYPQGMRSLTIKVAGKGVDFSRMKATFDTSPAY